MQGKSRRGTEVLEKIQSVASSVYEAVRQRRKPSVETPLRSLSNVEYDQEHGYFALKGRTKERTLTAATIKSFAQSLLMMNESKKLIVNSDIATKREMYYISKNWQEALFSDQPESDAVMDDIEAMMMVNREQMGFIPEEKGGHVAGELIVVDQDPDTGNDLEIDCTRFGSGAYSVPASVEHLRFKTNAEFILAIETSGMFERLNKHKYWRQANCILVAMGGVPTRACRRFIRKLSDDLNLPVYVFTDGDPYGYLNIYRTLKVGSGNSAHINEYFCVPNAKFWGITPQDVRDYNLPTHPLKDVDIKRVKDGIKNDPFIKHHTEWQDALQEQVKMKKRAEQQALAKHGLNFVLSGYLPKKYEDVKSWLP